MNNMKPLDPTKEEESRTQNSHSQSLKIMDRVQRGVQSDFSDAACPNCKQNKSQIKSAYESNFKLIKKKMLGTSELIQKYHQNQQDLAEANNKLKIQNERLERACRESGMLRIQLDKALKALNPLKKTIHRNESEKALLQYDLQKKDSLLNKSKVYTNELRDSVESTKMAEIDQNKEKQSISKDFEREKKRTLSQAKTIEKLDRKLQQVRDLLKEERKTSKRTSKEFNKLQKELEEKKAMELLPDTEYRKNTRRRVGSARGRARRRGGKGASFRQKVNQEDNNNNGEVGVGAEEGGFDYKSLFTDDEMRNIYDEEENDSSDQDFKDVSIQRNVPKASEAKRKPPTRQKKTSNSSNNKPGIPVKRRRSSRLNNLQPSPTNIPPDGFRDNRQNPSPLPTPLDNDAPQFHNPRTLEGLRLSDSSSEEDTIETLKEENDNRKLIHKIFRQMSTITPTISPLAATSPSPLHDNDDHISDIGGHSPYLSDMDENENLLSFDEPTDLSIENVVNDVMNFLVDSVCSDRINPRQLHHALPEAERTLHIPEDGDSKDNLNETQNRTLKTLENVYKTTNQNQKTLNENLKSEKITPSKSKKVSFEDKMTTSESLQRSPSKSGKTFISCSVSKIIKSILVTDFELYPQHNTMKNDCVKQTEPRVENTENQNDYKTTKDTSTLSINQSRLPSMSKENTDMLHSRVTATQQTPTPPRSANTSRPSSNTKFAIKTTPSKDSTSSTNAATEKDESHPDTTKSKWKQNSFKSVASGVKLIAKDSTQNDNESNTNNEDDIVISSETVNAGNGTPGHSSTGTRTFEIESQDRQSTALQQPQQKPSVVRALPGLSESSPGRPMRILKSILVEDIYSSPSMMERFKDSANFKEPFHRPLSPIAATPPRKLRRRDKEKACTKPTNKCPIESEQSKNETAPSGRPNLRRSARRDLSIINESSTLRNNGKNQSVSQVRENSLDTTEERPLSAIHTSPEPDIPPSLDTSSLATESNAEKSTAAVSITANNVRTAPFTTIQASTNQNTPLNEKMETPRLHNTQSSITSSTENSDEIDRNFPPSPPTTTTQESPEHTSTSLCTTTRNFPIEMQRLGGHASPNNTESPPTSSPPLLVSSSVSTSSVPSFPSTTSPSNISTLASRIISAVACPTPATPSVASPNRSSTVQPPYIPRYRPSTQVTYSSTHTSHIPRHRPLASSLHSPRSYNSRKHVTFTNAAKIRDIRRKTASPTMAISPPISPIPPSPRRTILTPLISPLPVTPLPDSISPLPPSPKIMSPPLIRGSAIQHSENSSVRVPVPIARKRSLSTQSISFDNETLSTSQNKNKKCRIQNDGASNESGVHPPSAFTKQRPSTSRKDTSLHAVKKPTNVSTAPGGSEPSSQSESTVDPQSLSVIVSEGYNTSTLSTQKYKDGHAARVTDKRLKPAQTSETANAVRGKNSSPKILPTTNNDKRKEIKSAISSSSSTLKKDNDKTITEMVGLKATTPFKRCVKRTSVSPTSKTEKSLNPIETPAKKQKKPMITKQKEPCEIVSPATKKTEKSRTATGAKCGASVKILGAKEIKEMDRESGLSEKKYVRQVIEMLRKDEINLRSIILAFQKRTNIMSQRSLVAAFVDCSMERGKKVLSADLTTNSNYHKKTDKSSAFCPYNGVVRLLDVDMLRTRDEEQLLCILNGLKNAYLFRNGPHELLEVIHKTLHKEVKLQLRQQETLCRFYAGVCRIFNMLDKLIAFLYGVCYDNLSHLNFAICFLSCYIVWPSIVFRCDLMDFAKKKEEEGRLTRVIMSPMSSAMQFISWFDCKDPIIHKDMRKLANDFFSLGLGTERKWNDLFPLLKGLAKEIYHLLSNKKISSIQGDSDTGYHLNEYAFSTTKALVLICRRVGWQYTHNKVICDSIWKSLEGAFSTPESSQCDTGVLVYLIGQLIQVGITSGWLDYSEIVNRIALVLSPENAQVHEKVQYAAATVLKEALHYHPQLCIQPIQQWISNLRKSKGGILPKYVLDQFEIFLVYDGT